MKQLSTHFTLPEATYSVTAKNSFINNIPPDNILSVMIVTADHMETVRELLGVPIKINSWYRSPALNLAVGSKSTSQHLKGEAVDFVSPAFGSPLEIAKLLTANKDKLQFDQLILEHTWIHISFAILTGKPRGQVLSLLHNNSYAIGLTDPAGVPYN